MVSTIIRFGILTQANNAVNRITRNRATCKMIKELTDAGNAPTIDIVGTDVVIDAPLSLIFAVRDFGYRVDETGGRQV